MTIRFKGFISLHTCMFPKLKYMFLFFVIALFVYCFQICFIYTIFLFWSLYPTGSYSYFKEKRNCRYGKDFPFNSQK